MGFLLRFESVASPRTPEQAVAELVEIGRRLGVGVISSINGRDAFAFPGMELEEVIRLWKRDALLTASGHRRKRQAARS